MTTAQGGKPELTRIVIVGAGFGGLSAALALRNAPVDVTIIDRRNFHLFQPLLYQVATASLSPADISAPIRSVLRGQANARVVLDKVVGVDRASRLVHTAEGRAVAYDHLILATGARHSYFGRDHWADIAPGIKTIDDATRVRAKILLAFERAELETDMAKRAALLTFVIVGAGPTGVELAGAIAELARKSVVRDFRNITPHCAKIVLLEAGPRILPSFRADLSRAAHDALDAMGVTVLTGRAVTEIDATTVTISGERIAAATILWAAGVKASPAAKWLEATSDRAGRTIVNSDFSIPGHPEIFVIGDTAAASDGAGGTLPGVAPAAKQAGEWVGRKLAGMTSNSGSLKPFRYRHPGAMATIGRQFAIVDLGFLRLTGFAGWALWSIAHIWFLIGFRSRMSVAMSWMWSYLTFERGARLITGREIALAQPFQAPLQQKDAA